MIEPGRQLWPLAALLAVPEDALLTRVTSGTRVTILAENSVDLLTLTRGIRLLSDRAIEVTVRIQRADAEVLRTLQQAGAQAIEWAVRAPTELASHAWTQKPDEARALQAAMRLAGEHQLNVRLRWRVAERTLKTLENLHELSGLAPLVEVIALPWLSAEEAPPLDAVIATWPLQLPENLRLLRSSLWPACMPGLQVEPATQAEQREADAKYLEPCENCPIRAPSPTQTGCAGVPLAIATRGPGQDWQGWQGLGKAAQNPEISRVDVHCVEARGLALGLRRAWRLFLPPSQLMEYQQIFRPLGWHVAATAHVDAGTGGIVRADGQGEHVLTVVARTQAEAEACLRDELSNLQRQPALTTEAQRSHWEDLAATHRRLGAAYGYPTCCVEAFLDAHGEIVELQRETDNAMPILRAALRTRKFHPDLLSLPGLLGEEARSPLRHMPCRFDCPASLALAQTLLADLAVHNPTWSARHAEQLPDQIVVFADGTLLRLQGIAETPEHVQQIRQVQPQPSQVASPQFLKWIQALPALGPLEALHVQAGIGLRVLHHETWHDLPLPPETISLPRAQEFPLLLPFGLL